MSTNQRLKSTKITWLFLLILPNKYDTMTLKQMMIQLPFERRSINGYFKRQKFDENEQYL